MIKPILTSLGCPKVLGKTHRHTHCQIVAQMKLRTIIISWLLIKMLILKEDINK